MTALMKKLSGGPMSMLPMSPLKGSGMKSLKGNTPLRPRNFVVPKQNPARNPGFLSKKRK